ncbi:MAG: beta-glucosidase [Clostridiales bacterium]|nr:beta-glucosidase [Clostridiales bacterium]
MKRYEDVSLSPQERAQALLSEMTTEDKIWQVCGDMSFFIDGVDSRDHRKGHVRSSAHFMHTTDAYHPKENFSPKTTREAAELINKDIARSIRENPNKIPYIVHDEALHGAQWGMATCFPQPIALASSFDDELMEKVSDVIARESRVVGVRQVLTPNINICRDVRWGRAVETFGEDVLLTSNFGVIMCKAFDKHGVIATPKHFIDNYADGGRDSNESHSSERTLREVYYKPFERCFKEGGAKSVMCAYNSVDGMPCHCNGKLLNDLLRDEWGFDGFTVSDYGGIEGLQQKHLVADELHKALGFAMENGFDVKLPNASPETVQKALDEGYLSEEALDKSVLRVLTQKFRLGLMDDPFIDVEEASRIVRNDEAKAIAKEAAREATVLLKNDGILPLQKTKLKKLGVFGQSAKVLPIGENYSGAYGGWYAEDALTPLQALKLYLGEEVEVIFGEEGDAERLAKECDVNIYFTSVIEGEGMDRSDLTLPMIKSAQQQDQGAIIVDKRELVIKENQEDLIKKICQSNENTVIVLLNGAPIEMSNWIDGAKAVLEAWYPGEQGAMAIAELLFGEYSPSGKLPFTFPRSVGQLPLCYSFRPSGRGYGYCDNDGSPLYCFGYGLSYTEFKLSDCALRTDGVNVSVVGKIKNVGQMDGAEVLQVYVSGRNCYIARPNKELKGYKRVFVKKGETVDFEICLDKEAFYFYNDKMQFGCHNGDYTVTLGNDSQNAIQSFELKARSGQILKA